MQLDVEYQAAGPVCDQFLQSEAFVRGIRGPIGSGKSTACCFEILRRSMAQKPSADGKRRTRWAIIRNTFPELRTTTMKTWWGIAPQEVGKWVDEGPPSHTLEGDGFHIEVLFLALDRPDDIKKLLSLELTGAWINEAREVPKAILDALTGRVGRYPAVKDGGCTWFGILLDTNPPDTDHWWYRLAEEECPKEFEFYAQPSGLSPDAENIDNLPPGYYERASLGKTEDWIRVYVRGEYGFAMDGKAVYPEYSDSLHCRPVTIDPRLDLRIGMDFGLTPAATFGQRGPMGDWRIKSEVVCEDMGAIRFAEAITRHVNDNYANIKIGGITGDPAGEARAGTDEQTVFQVLRAHKVIAHPAPSNDFTLRREAVARPLTRLVGPVPGLIIDPGCIKLRKAMAGGYCFRRLKVAGEDRFQDKPDKNMHSHVAESLQYLLLGAGEGRTLVRDPSMVRQSRESVTSYRVLG
jgi:hypothetical protein